MLEARIAQDVPRAVNVLGFSTIEAAQSWLADLRREDTKEGGEIYFACCKDADHEYVKIGYSTDIMERLKGLQVASPFKYELLARISGTPEMESSIHEKFAHLRKQGEWFHLTDELWAFIKATRNESQWKSTTR